LLAQWRRHSSCIVDRLQLACHRRARGHSFFSRSPGGTIFDLRCLIGLVDGAGGAIAPSSSLIWPQRDDAMKWTLMVSTCLLAFAFSPPAFARQSHKQPHEKVYAHAHLAHVRGHAAARAEGEAAPASKHMASTRSGEHRHHLAAISSRHAAGEHRARPHVASLARRHAGSSSRHGRFVAVRNRTLREARGDGSASGSVGVASYYSAHGLTAAHRSLPFGTRVRVTNLSNGTSVVVRINDRGPFIRGRSIDLSTGAARAIGMTGAGVARVRMHVI
jgi:rare lipoprotein A